jgi:thymidine kinase
MKHSTGSIEVITGSMFCGKTDELIRRLRRATIARQKVQVFKPAMDHRYALEKVTSHAGSEYAAQPVPNAHAILEHLDAATTVVGIDEAQFFDETIISLAQELADRGVRLIIAGLDTDFRGEPFGPMPVLMAKAEVVDKLHAICMVCGQLACRTQRLVDGKPARYHDPIVSSARQRCTRPAAAPITKCPQRDPRVKTPILLPVGGSLDGGAVWQHD